MKRKTKSITYSAIAAAFSVVLLLVASVAPTGQIGFIAATSLCSLFGTLYGGIKSAVSIYALSSLIGLFILPDKTPLVFYVLFFGYYPILRILTEKLPTAARWVAKLVMLNASLFFIKLVLSKIIFGFSIFGDREFLYYLVCSAIFVVFDIGVSKVYEYFRRKLAR